ncbi:diguanylate phosphodiesterase [Evansella cellulosilytica DSM 2522]|uniref:Diguanylate phosphodiesterase n=1 Tax=Evansella cellulosilytica (strain ATCC 21833 / DSM 2522 / FERM P-1141 / JCM 9156 / N-4) TaxID=649639 RepID=E6TUR3_EVAC2|nr:diguanylate phosphodiesterase [Evansella cellulosilytica DSM 2522]
MERCFKMESSQDFYHLFQPIINTNFPEKPIGYEAFIRNRHEKNPLKIFEKARKNNSLLEIDLHSINCALKYADSSNSAYHLFINIFPSTLVSDAFLALLDKIVNKPVILEINEANEETTIWNNPLLKKNILLLQEHNIKWALDDVGTGQASIQRIFEYQPNYIKLDKYFSNELSARKEKQKVVTFFVDLTKYMGSHFILEGIEKETDLKIAKELGVRNVQGFLFGKPQKEISHPRSDCCASKVN